jgi:uncharacterized protein
MKQLIFVFLLLVLSIFLAVRSQKGELSSLLPKSTPPSPTASIDGHTFKVEVVKSEKDKEIGLTKYSSLSDDKGMDFPFDSEGIYPFWMKNMKFPIDILFIDKNKIVDIKESLPPADPNQQNIPTYAPSHVVDNALEISAGLSEKYKFKVGDSVTFSPTK